MNKRIIGTIAVCLVTTVGAMFLAPPSQAQLDQFYSFAKYKTVADLVAAGAAPTRLGAAVVEGTATQNDGQGKIFLWSDTSTATTNSATSGYTVLQADGVTTGRWLALQTRTGLAALMGAQYGTLTAAEDGTVTNTFTSAYAAAPKVLVIPTGSPATTTNAVSITATKFVWTSGADAATATWIALP